MTLAYIAVFIFGCCIGSFLNCAIYRMEHQKRFVKGRSFCPKCKHKLSCCDLIPILSFLILKGRCRYCKQKIAIQYLIAEIATGLLFLLIFNFQFSIFNEFSIFQFLKLLYLLSVACLLEVIFIYDLKHYIIPDRLVFPAIGLAFLYQFFLFLNCKLKIENLTNLALAILVSSGFFFLIWLISRGRWLGFGDVKLALFMGLFLGWPNILMALFFAFISGAIIGLILIVLQKKKMKSEVPFGPFLVAGTFFALFLGEKIFNWYLSFIL